MLAFLHNYHCKTGGESSEASSAWLISSILPPHNGDKWYSVMDSWPFSGPLSVQIFYLDFLFFSKVLWVLIDQLRPTLEGAVLKHFGKGFFKTNNNNNNSKTITEFYEKLSHTWLLETQLLHFDCPLPRG